MSCPMCERTDPHSHDLGVVLNARRFCPGGERHSLVDERRWFRWWRRCTRCDERLHP